MKPKILILRPQPGCIATAARAAELGWHSVSASLFKIVPVAWSPPPASDYDAVMMTSANAARRAGPGLARYRRLPLYAVGQATAEAARQSGFIDVRSGAGNSAELAVRAAADGIVRMLHLTGREHRAVSQDGIIVDRRIVYAADAVGELQDEARAALAEGAVALLHSPRAASLFAALVDEGGLARSGIRIAAISPAALEEAGGGWDAARAAEKPTDSALLAAAARLCE